MNALASQDFILLTPAFPPFHPPSLPPSAPYQMLGRVDAEVDSDAAAAADTAAAGGGGGSGGGGGADGERASAPAAAAGAAEQLGPRVLLPNEHEAFITTYVSEDGHHWALTLDVVPLLSAEEEAEAAAAAEQEEEEEEEEEGCGGGEEGEVSSILFSLPTSPLARPDDASYLPAFLERR